MKRQYLIPLAFALSALPLSAAAATKPVVKTASISQINTAVTHSRDAFALPKGYTTSGIVTSIENNAEDKQAILNQGLGGGNVTIGRAYFETLVIRDPNGSETVACSVGLSFFDPEILRTFSSSSSADQQGAALDAATNRKMSVLRALRPGSLVTVTGYDPRLGTQGVAMYGCDVRAGGIASLTAKPHPSTAINVTALEDQYLRAKNEGNTADFYQSHFGKVMNLSGIVEQIGTNDVIGDGSQIMTTVFLETHRATGYGTTAAVTCDLINASDAHGLRKGMRIVVRGTFNQQSDGALPGMLSFKDCAIVR